MCFYFCNRQITFLLYMSGFLLSRSQLKLFEPTQLSCGFLYTKNSQVRFGKSYLTDSDTYFKCQLYKIFFGRQFFLRDPRKYFFGNRILILSSPRSLTIVIFVNYHFSTLSIKALIFPLSQQSLSVSDIRQELTIAPSLN